MITAMAAKTFTDDPGLAPEQIEAARRIRNATITLGEAEGVFSQAVAGMADAIRQGTEAGIALADISQLALLHDTLHALSRGQILLAIRDETRRQQRAAEAEGEKQPASGGQESDTDKIVSSRHRATTALPQTRPGRRRSQPGAT